MTVFWVMYLMVGVGVWQGSKGLLQFSVDYRDWFEGLGVMLIGAVLWPTILGGIIAQMGIDGVKIKRRGDNNG